MPLTRPGGSSKFYSGVVFFGFFLTQSVSFCDGDAFINWENPPLHAVAISPDGQRLAVVNLPDNRLELFSLSSGTPVSIGAASVGLDPVSVRFYDDQYACVVNHISDTISVVDALGKQVVATVQTADEPYDLIFAGDPLRAYVSCSQANLIQVIDPATWTVTEEIPVDGEDPRALAASPDGLTVYVAIFESGNASTILGGGSTMNGGFPPNVVSNVSSPYTGQNPPPNDGVNFDPPIAVGLPTPPAVGLIVKKNSAGQWMDDNGGNWTNLVSGPNASASGRAPGWDLSDHDIAIINTSSHDVNYATGLMNIGMALAVNPASGTITLVGTDAINEVRFEPKISGIFVRAMLAAVDPDDLSKTVTDLNAGHLDYTTSTIDQSLRDLSIGNPRGIVWTADGTRGYVTGMGSNNLIIIDSSGVRVGAGQIDLPEGPLALVLDEPRNQLYVLNRFDASLSVVSTTNETVTRTIPLHDSTPLAIRLGRRHFYNTHETSGLGQLSCASCHIDGRMDRLAWDLGAPNGSMKAVTDVTGGGQHNLNAGLITSGFEDFHPMKGPMLTQTLIDIIGHEPFHWRGDRDGIEEFNGAFVSLQGDDEMLTPQEMQEFEDFLATLTVNPNPFRNFDNTLPTSLPLPDQFATGRHTLTGGIPLPAGNAQNGLNMYRTVNFDGGALTCVNCHTLPTGQGTDYTAAALTFQPIPPGVNGEHHLMLVSVDGSTNVTQTVAPLRNLYERMGFNAFGSGNRAGFGFLHDGSIDTLARFVDEPVFNTSSDQQVADLVAFLLSFSGSDLPAGSTNVLDGEPPGSPSKDSPAAVGRQVTITDNTAVNLFGQADAIAAMISLADAPGGRVDLIVKGGMDNDQQGWVYDADSNLFLADQVGQTISSADLRNLASPGTPLTYTLVPAGSGVRMGIDRDENGVLDGDEPKFVWNCSAQPFGDSDGDGKVGLSDWAHVSTGWLSTSGDAGYACAADFDHNGEIALNELLVLIANWLNDNLSPCSFGACE